MQGGGYISNISAQSAFVIGASNSNTNSNLRNLQADVIFAPAPPTVTWTGLAGSGGTASWDMSSLNWTGTAASMPYTDANAVIFPTSGTNTNIRITAGGVGRSGSRSAMARLPTRFPVERSPTPTGPQFCSPRRRAW